MITTRRRFLLLAGGTIAVSGCGALATKAAARAAPWVGQFLLEVAVNVTSELISDLFDRSTDEELALLEPNRAQLIRGGFTDALTTHFDTGSGVADVYRGGGRIAFAQVDKSAPYETCVGLCDVNAGTRVAVEGPVLGALHLTNIALADRGLKSSDIDGLTTPLKLASPRGEIAGDEMRFDEPFAIRRYRTRSGSRQVTWEQQSADGSGACLVDINDKELVFEVPQLAPEGRYL